MTYYLTELTRQHILAAFDFYRTNPSYLPTDLAEVYWFDYQGRLYPFRWIIHSADVFDGHIEKSTHPIFNYNLRWLNDIAERGFHLRYQDRRLPYSDPVHWIAAPYYGPAGKLEDQLEHFRRNDFWGTDHEPATTEGRKIFSQLRKVMHNDRIAIRYLDKKGSTIRIAALGTVYDLSRITEGEIGVKWDIGASLDTYSLPKGPGAGNWWKTFFELKRIEDINLIFQTANAGRRVARIAWNELQWIMPSGRVGKSRDPGSHEAKFGFGGEEWLFDMTKLIDGYHYAFLEPINKQPQPFEGKTYEVFLYTIDGVSKVRYWVGAIAQTQVLTADEATRVKVQYIRKGWLEEMRQQIEDAHGISTGFLEKKGIDLFNIRFLPSDLREFGTVEIPDGNAVLRYGRYAFGHYRDDFGADKATEGGDMSFITSPAIRPNDLIVPPSVSSSRAPRLLENKRLHEKMSRHLTKKLKKELGNDRVTREHPAAHGRKRIDIVAVKDGKMIFYELKTYNDLLSCIREAVGQLLEYAVWKDKDRAVKWIIVTHFEVTADVAAYLSHLRNHYGMPFYYQYYRWETDDLSPEF